MLQAAVYNQDGIEVKKTEIPESIFGVALNHDLVHQAAVAQRANARIPWAHAKTREEVSGGGKKPWRQKGTGRARHGSTRSPIWRGGGVSFGPQKDRDYSQKLNKKMKRQAIFMLLSKKFADGALAFVDNIALSEAKTRAAHDVLKKFTREVFSFPPAKRYAAKKVLIVEPAKDVMLERAVKNIPWVRVIGADSMNVLDTLSCEYLIVMERSVAVLSKTFLQKKSVK